MTDKTISQFKSKFICSEYSRHYLTGKTKNVELWKIKTLNLKDIKEIFFDEQSK